MVQKSTTPPDPKATPPEIVEPTGTVARIPREQLEEITSFDEMIATLAQVHGEVISSEAFAPVEKDDLINIPFVIIEWEDGKKKDFGEKRFVIVRIMVQATEEKGVFTDGSTGVMHRLDRWAAQGRTGGILVPRGLRKSEYGLTKDGDTCVLGSPEAAGKGVTYYL
jgi:hypothetical protein